MTEIGGNLAMIVGAWTAMLSSGNTESLGAILDEGVTWQGVLPDQICRNREEVLDILIRNQRRPPRLTRIEAAEFGDRVVVSVESPDFEEMDGRPRGPRSLVFTFRNGRVVRMESIATRDAAFDLVNVRR
jgi:hypothetical protein